MTGDLRQYTYDGLGRISQITTDARAKHALSSAEMDCCYTFDDFGRVSRMSYYVGNSEKERHEYGYDKNDQISSEAVMNVWGADPVSTETEYTYDRLGKLTGSDLTDNIDSSGDRTVTYTYDIDGNRTERAEGNVVTENTFDGLNRQTASVTTRDPSGANEGL